MASTPQTTIKLYKFETDITYRNVYGFYSQSQLNTFLNAHLQYTLQNQQYVRRDFHIELNLPFDSVEDITYVSYNNGEGLGEEYAFVKEKHFVNFNCVRFVLQYDVWTNVMKANNFSSAAFKGFVEREHGNYNVPNIRADVAVNANIRRFNSFANFDYTFVVFASDKLNSSPEAGTTVTAFRGNDFDRVALSYMLFDSNNVSVYGGYNLEEYTSRMSESPYIYSTYYCKVSSAMKNAILAKSALFNAQIGGMTGSVQVPLYTYTGTEKIPSFSANITDPDLYIDDFDEKDDAKIHTSPYQYALLVTAKNQLVLPYEYIHYDSFHNAKIAQRLTFDANGIYTLFTPDFNTGYNAEILDRYTVSASRSVNEADLYAIQNSGGYLLDAIGILSTPITAAFGHPEMSLLAAGDLGRRFTSNFAAMFEPQKSVKGVSISDGYIYIENGEYAIFHMSVDDEAEKILLNMWDSTGYPVNEYKTINYHTRTKYNYVRASDVNTVTTLCNSEREVIKEMFRQGITVWHEGTSTIFGNYRGNTVNTIIP